jgi:hypothetical protein
VGGVSLTTAAEVLGMTAASVSQALDRRAVRVGDGGVEAELVGVRAPGPRRPSCVTVSHLGDDQRGVYAPRDTRLDELGVGR